LIDPDDEIICRNVASFDLAFCDGTDWWATWDSSMEKDVLPTAVMVTIDLEPPPSRVAAGDTTLLRFSRVIPLPCTGGAELSTREDSTGTEGGSDTAGSNAGGTQ
jgi:hypothetical protein